MKYSVSGNPAKGYSVAKVEGYGKVDSGYPTYYGFKVAEGFSSPEEAFAWAKQQDWDKDWGRK